MKGSVSPDFWGNWSNNLIFQRKGRLFNLSDYTLPDGCVGYAQSPQALELEDRVRIFFSTRSRDKVGKFISHVCFVDVSRDFEQVLFISERPVISPGELGAFDEHGIFLVCQAQK